MVEGALESDGSLAGNVLELTQMLTRYNQELRDRNEEKSRLSGVQAEFKKHLAWQKQRAHALNRNVEKLFNESSWLEQKTTEVRQDAQLVAHELRQCKAEVDQVAAPRPTARGAR